MKAKEPEQNRMGPVNPFGLGNVFIEAARKLGWIEEEQVDRQRRYFITSKGFAEMEKLGMDLQRVVHYRPMTPPPEGVPLRHVQPMPRPEISLSHHQRPQPRSHHFNPRHERPQRHGRHEQNRPHDRQHDRNNDRHRY